MSEDTPDELLHLVRLMLAEMQVGKEAVRAADELMAYIRLPLDVRGTPEGLDAGGRLVEAAADFLERQLELRREVVAEASRQPNAGLKADAAIDDQWLDELESRVVRMRHLRMQLREAQGRRGAPPPLA